VAPTKHPVVDRDFRALLRHELGLDRRGVAVDRVAGVGDRLAAILLDLADVAPLQQVGEERGELLAVRLREILPVPTERALRRLAEIKDGVRDLADGGTARLLCL